MLKHTKISLIIRGVLFAALGIFCLCSPKGTLEGIAWIIGICLIAVGVVTFFLGRKGDKGVDTMYLISAILMAAVGVVVIIRPQIISIILGVLIVFEGIEFLIQAIRCQKSGVRHWGMILVVSLIIIAFGLWAVFTPWVGATLLSLIVGIGSIGIAVDCFAMLAGLGRLERFFHEEKKMIGE